MCCQAMSLCGSTPVTLINIQCVFLSTKWNPTYLFQPTISNLPCSDHPDRDKKTGRLNQTSAGSGVYPIQSWVRGTPIQSCWKDTPHQQDVVPPVSQMGYPPLPIEVWIDKLKTVPSPILRMRAVKMKLRCSILNYIIYQSTPVTVTSPDIYISTENTCYYIFQWAQMFSELFFWSFRLCFVKSIWSLSGAGLRYDWDCVGFRASL